MALFETPETPAFDDELRQLETSDKAHATLFNTLFGKLFVNTLFLKKKVEETTAAIDTAYQNGNAYTDQKIANLINGAPTTLDTLKEIADALEENSDVITVLENAIDGLNNSVSNCILEMPTKPTYSGLAVTVYAGTKVVLPNGRNADGTMKNIIFTLATNMTTDNQSLNNARTIFVTATPGAYGNPTSAMLYVDRLSELPTTVATSIYVYRCFCEETNLWYTSTGSTTANWVLSTPLCVIATAVVGASTITSLVPRDTLKLAQQEDFVAFKKNFQDGLNTIASAITSNGVSTASNASPTTMATNIGNIRSDGTATAAQILTGYNARSQKNLISGSMPNRGAWATSISATTYVNIPAGYHNGSGYVNCEGIGIEILLDNSNGDGSLGFSKNYRFVIFSMTAKRDVAFSSGVSAVGNWTLDVNYTQTDGHDMQIKTLHMWNVVPGHSISWSVGTQAWNSRVVAYGIF